MNKDHLMVHLSFYTDYKRRTLRLVPPVQPSRDKDEYRIALALQRAAASIQYWLGVNGCQNAPPGPEGNPGLLQEKINPALLFESQADGNVAFEGNPRGQRPVANKPPLLQNLGRLLQLLPFVCKGTRLLKTPAEQPEATKPNAF